MFEEQPLWGIPHLNVTGPELGVRECVSPEINCCFTNLLRDSEDYSLSFDHRPHSPEFSQIFDRKAVPMSMIKDILAWNTMMG